MRTMPSFEIPYDILLARAGIPTLLSRRQVAQLKLTFTATQGLLPAHFQATSPRGLCPVHPMWWPNTIFVSVYHAHGKTPNGSRHSNSTILFLCGTLFQQNYRDQRALSPCSFFFTSYTVWTLTTSSLLGPLHSCVCSNSIPPRLSHSQ